jgi:hypothetical protein
MNYNLKVFCQSEKVNEEYMRVLLFEEKSKFLINKIAALKAMALVPIKWFLTLIK